MKKKKKEKKKKEKKKRKKKTIELAYVSTKYRYVCCTLLVSAL